MLRLTNLPVPTAPPSKYSSSSGRGTTELGTKLDIVNARDAELISVETITVRRHVELLKKLNNVLPKRPVSE